MKRLIMGLIAPLMVLAPASAEVQPGTRDLIDTVGQYLTVNIDDAHCDDNPGIAGSFAPKTKTITLCPGGDVDADDHDTVRHEVWHVIQYCLTDENSPILEPVIDPHSKEWDDYVMGNLTDKQIEFIKESYPRYMWDAELEAFAVAKAARASFLKEQFIKSCIN